MLHAKENCAGLLEMVLKKKRATKSALNLFVIHTGIYWSTLEQLPFFVAASNVGQNR